MLNIFHIISHPIATIFTTNGLQQPNNRANDAQYLYRISSYKSPASTGANAVMKATAIATPRCPCSATRLVEALVEPFASFGVDVAVAVAVVIDSVGDAVETLLAIKMSAIWLSPSTRTRPIPLWR